MFGKRFFAAIFLFTVLAVTFLGCSFFPGSSSSSGTDANPTAPAVDNPTNQQGFLDFTTVVRGIASFSLKASEAKTIEITGPELKGLRIEIPANALSTDSQILINAVDSPPDLPQGLNYLGFPFEIVLPENSLVGTIALKIPLSEGNLSDGGANSNSEIKLLVFNHKTKSWIEIPSEIIATSANNSKVRSQIGFKAGQLISAFTWYARDGDYYSMALSGFNQKPPENLGNPQPGDLLYKLGNFGVIEGVLNLAGLTLEDYGKKSGYGWRPGHVGIYVGYRIASDGQPYNVIEALGAGVTRSYYNPINHFAWNKISKTDPKFDTFMGARQPNKQKFGTLTQGQRKAIVDFAETQAQNKRKYAYGKMFGSMFGSLPGNWVKGEGINGNFNCVGLAEAAYEHANPPVKSLLEPDLGLVSYLREQDGTLITAVDVFAGTDGYGLTPAEQYNETEPAEGDGILPDVSISSPGNGTTFTAGEEIPITVNATDTDGIYEIQIYRDNTLVAFQRFAPPTLFGANFDASGKPSLTYSLKNATERSFLISASAKDVLGNTKKTEGVLIKVVPPGTQTTTVGTPTGVTATPGNGQVTISWNPVNGAQAYNIYWTTTAGVTKTSNQLANKTSPYSHTSTVTSTGGGGFGEFSIKAGVRAALTNGTTYYYAVTASNSVGESSLSNEVSATPKAGVVTDTTPPVISAVTSGSLATTSAVITWTTNEDSTSQVEYGTTTAYGSTTTLDSTKTKSHSVNLTGLAAATAYHYRVKSKDAAGNEGVTTDNTFTTSVGLAAPAAPTNVAVTATDTKNILSWTAVTGATTYNLYWSTTTGVTKTNGTKITGVTSPYPHTALRNGTAYYYVVTAVNTSGESGDSSQVTGTPTTPPTQVVQIQLAEIPAGTFTMGEVWLAEPVHQVIISKAFFMGLYEVTQGQYKQLMGTNPSYFVPTQTAYSSGYSNTDNQPVEQVSWFDSVRFCNAISLNQGLTPCYTNQSGNSTIVDNDTVTCNWSANGYRLPTEAEWEYACRGGTTSRYYWASSYDEAQTKQYCWFGLNANGDGGTTNQHWTTPHADKGGTQPVGTKLPNAFGLYDMSGNVSEWCNDWYGDYSSSAQTDPKGATTGNSRVLRSSSWFGSIFDVFIGSKDYLGSAHRQNKTPTYRDTYLNSYGFRVCRNKQ